MEKDTNFWREIIFIAVIALIDFAFMFAALYYAFIHLQKGEWYWSVILVIIAITEGFKGRKYLNTADQSCIKALIYERYKKDKEDTDAK